MNYSISTGGTIELRGTAVLNIRAVSSCEKNVISVVQLGGEDLRPAPSILISYLSEDKSIWEVAKKYNISRAKLMSANDIKSEEELKGRRALVIPR